MLTFAVEKKRPSPVIRQRPVPTMTAMHPSWHAQHAEIRAILHTPSVQPKLTINQPNDIYEQEADRVAERVMRMPEPACPECEEEIEQIAPLVQRQVDLADIEDEEEESLQAKAGSTLIPTVLPVLESRISSVRGSGQPLSPSTRAFFEPRFDRDFSDVRIHAGGTAGDTARAVNARAFTLGRDIVFGSGQYAPSTHSGRRLLAHELAHVVQQTDERAAGNLLRVPLPELVAPVKDVPAAEKDDDELVHGIIGAQLAILKGWETALRNFDKVLTSAPDKSTKPNFNKVVVSFLKDKLMGEMISKANVKGAGEAFALLGQLEAEVKRAEEAQQSANLRDFYVQYNTAIGKLQQKVESLRDDFLAKVRLTGERQTKDDISISEYGLMRMHLVELLERLDFLLKISTPENLFMELSEEWLRQSTILREPAFILIRLEEDFSIRKAEIKGPGGQKIAEQLLRDSPQGVDVFDMKIRRRILYYKPGEYFWSACVNLDENGKLVYRGIPLEGKYALISRIYRFLVRNGLPPTKKLSGD